MDPDHCYVQVHTSNLNFFAKIGSSDQHYSINCPFLHLLAKHVFNQRVNIAFTKQRLCLYLDEILRLIMISVIFLLQFRFKDKERLSVSN